MDLHIHTCLSPCGEDDMVPSRIVDAALRCGLDGIAITDHNCAANVKAVRLAAGARGLSVIGGMEITTKEEVHVLAWFDSDVDLEAMQKMVVSRLTEENVPRYFGNQRIVDAGDDVVGELSPLLIGTTDLGVDEVVNAIHRHGGLAVAAHIDRPSYSVISQLGFIPPDVPFDGVELSRNDVSVEDFFLGGQGDKDRHLAVIASSDAHRPEDIGRARTRFMIESVSVAEIGQALRAENGRCVMESYG